MKIVGIIPARYQSSRFPGKPLVQLHNKPMVIWVAEIAAKALKKENVYIATDNSQISAVAKQHGFKSILTSGKHLTGTDRVWEASLSIQADIYINIQGDEPLIHPDDIIKIVSIKKNHPNRVITGRCKIQSGEDPYNLNFPKVIANESGDLVYISRVPLPAFKSPENKPKIYWRQVCIYAFTREELSLFGKFGRKSTLEKNEDIEILRFLELSVKIKVAELNNYSHAVDIPEDVAVVEKLL